MTATIEGRLTSPAHTFAVGKALGTALQGGDFLALCGPLGAGKTHLVKGLAVGLGVPADEPVVSPTFVLCREYDGNLKLYHIDAYRLGSADELVALGLDEMLNEPNAVLAVEWADRVTPAVPPAACWLELAHDGAETRHLTVRWSDTDRRDAVAAALRRG